MEAILNVILGLAAVVLILALFGRPRYTHNARPAATVTGKRRCPHCGSAIKRGYTTCRRCGH